MIDATIAKLDAEQEQITAWLAEISPQVEDARLRHYANERTIAVLREMKAAHSAAALTVEDGTLAG